MFNPHFEVPEYGMCSCCGATQLVLTRFAYRDDHPSAIYKAALTTGPHPPVADMVISIGDWSENSSPARRVAFAIHMSADTHGINVGIVEPNHISWSGSYWGSVLPRKQALQHEWLPLVFQLTDQIAQRDELLVAFLERRSADLTS
ncbi:hypothetical protein [Pseudorhizobium pelagicum]|uniref:Uncharacterized protein n=1 Tax=Pseudorhizobium pelagicum TaxID=1509405 RepID=A0A922NX58_9HYPH|nr:hypothetical protein [Pseudorhizobium pelagicum]KEQ03219.1 hypothetical protein GV68_17640 [Pseudorhizobium pelagicum]KEQ04902.1 hypothetical protein GV67_07330 [Pseudorhizobium pelagicum]